MTETEIAILREMVDDYLGLWRVVGIVRDIEGPGTEEGIREKCVEAMRSLVRKGLVEVGEARRGGGFDAWEVSGELAIDRISKEWRELKREPDIGEIAWLNLTPTGEAYAIGLEPEDRRS